MSDEKEFIPKRAMSIHAHPDDQEFTVAGTLAKWAKAGCEIISVIITSGDGGSNDPAHDASYKPTLAKIREGEQSAANETLGVKEDHLPALSRWRTRTDGGPAQGSDQTDPRAQAGSRCDRRSAGRFLRQRLHQPPRSPRRGAGGDLRRFPLRRVTAGLCRITGRRLRTAQRQAACTCTAPKNRIPGWILPRRSMSKSLR